MKSQPSFGIDSHEEFELIDKIAERAHRIDLKVNKLSARRRQDWVMDLLAANNALTNGLKLADMLAADDFNFAHDAFGIARHLNRKTGQLEDCFLPRFARIERLENAL